MQTAVLEHLHNKPRSLVLTLDCEISGKLLAYLFVFFFDVRFIFIDEYSEGQGIDIPVDMLMI